MDRSEQDILYIMIPAYNEEENIEALIEDWYPVTERHSGGGRSRLVVINDGSTDGTEEKLKAASDGRPLLEVITKQNGGHGQAVLCGYEYALKNGAEYIFQTDSDRQTSPADFENFWRQRQRFDAVVGNRYMREDGVSRMLVSKAVCLLIASILHVRVRDANTPFRLMKASALEDCLKYIEDDEKVPNIMLSAVFKRKKYRVLYRDIQFKARRAGKNSLNLRKISVLGADAVKRMRRLDERLRADNI